MNLLSVETKKAPSAFLVFFFYLSPFIGMYPDVVFGHASFLRRDITRYYYPVWQYAVESLKSGVVPLWNPFNGCGVPFLANPQTCVFYPPALFLYLPDYTWGFNFYILFHLALAGFGAYLWMRDRGGSPEASIVAGYSYGLSGYMMSTINLTIALCSAAYLPLVFLTVRRALGGRGFFWKGAASVTLLFQYLAGDPAVFFITVFSLFLFVVYRVVDRSLTEGRRAAAGLFRYGWVLIVFFGLAAFQMLPFCELLFHSTRTHLYWKEAMAWSVLPSDVWGLVVPFFSDFSMSVMDYWTRQSWLENYYSGISVVLLAFAAAAARKDETTRLHILLGLWGLLLSLGRYSPFYFFLHGHVPLLGLVRYPARFFFLVSFSLACLAGFGWDAVIHAPRPRRAARAHFLVPGLALVTLVLTVVLFAGAFDRVEEKVSSFVWGHYGRFWKQPFCTEESFRTFTAAAAANVKRSLIFAALALSGFYAAFFSRPRKGILASFFAVVVFADLWGANAATEARVPAQLIQKSSGNVSRVREDPALFRIFESPETIGLQTTPLGHTLTQIQEYITECLTPNLMLMYHIQDTSVYDSIYLADTSDVHHLALVMKSPDHNRLLDSLNVKYLVSPLAQVGGYQRIRSARPVNLFLNPRALPRCYLVKDAVVVTDRAKILEKLSSRAYDPLKEIYLESEPGVSPRGKNFQKGPPAEGGVSILEYEPQRVRMKATVTDRPWLFFSDAYYPGWRAWVDGKPAKILKANGAFRALALVGGVHEIIWRYDPVVWKIGVTISLASFFALLCTCVRITPWRRKI